MAAATPTELRQLLAEVTRVRETVLAVEYGKPVGSQRTERVLAICGDLGAAEAALQTRDRSQVEAATVTLRALDS